MTAKEPITKQPSVVQNTAGETGGKIDTNQLLAAQKTEDQEKLPLGLKTLSGTSEVTVKQHIDSVEVVMCCFARPCRYSVYSAKSSDQFLYVQEVSDCYARQIMGAARSFALKFSDPDFIDILKVVRPQTCSRGCCGICCQLPIMHIENPPGKRVAYIKEKRSCCYPTYHICNREDSLLYILRPRCCYSSLFGLCSDIQVDIFDDSGERVVAQLFKQTKGNTRDCIGQENNFTMKYLSEMPVIHKVILLGSSFLIDFHYFERQQRCCC